MTSPIYNPSQPHMLQIPGGLTSGRIIHITGIVAPNATSIVLKLQSGPYGDPHDEIGLCLYGRVLEGVLGLNSFTRAAGWGQEQTARTPALVRGQTIEITILSDPYVFKIAVNRVHLTEYRHAMNPALVNNLNTVSTPNDITLTYIWVQDPSQPAYPAPMGQPIPQAPGNMYTSPAAYGAPQYPGEVPVYTQSEQHHGQQFTNIQYPGEVPGYTESGQHPGKKSTNMAAMAGAAAVGVVAGAALGVAGGMAYSEHRRGSHSSSSSSDNPEGYGVQHTYVHHVHHDGGDYPSHQDNNEGGDINININIEGGNKSSSEEEKEEEPNVAALTLNDQQPEDNEEEEIEESSSSSSSSSEEEEPEEEPEDEPEDEPEEEDDE